MMQEENRNREKIKKKNKIFRNYNLKENILKELH